MTPFIPDIAIPAELLPRDGRFGSGPSKVRPEEVEALAASGTTYLGTSHRQGTVRFMVAALRNGIAELLSLPDGYEVALGNGGTTAFWDAATFGLIRDRAQFASFGEFGARFAKAAVDAPFLGDPTVRTGEPGSAAATMSVTGASGSYSTSTSSAASSASARLAATTMATISPTYRVISRHIAC